MNEFEGLGLSAETLAKIKDAGQRGAIRQAAADESAAADKVNELGLTGQGAENFKAKYVASLQAGRRSVRQHVRAVLESTEGKARPSAALAVAMRSDLTTDQAIAELAAMPPERDETEAAADFITGAGR